MLSPQQAPRTSEGRSALPSKLPAIEELPASLPKRPPRIFSTIRSIGCKCQCLPGSTGASRTYNTFVNHDVLNQPPPLADVDLFSTDRALKDAVARECAGWASVSLAEYGRKLGSAEMLECGAQANANPPVLHTHDRYGHRRDEVEFHPSWHRLMRLAVEQGVHSSPWADPRKGAHVARAAAAMLASECEAGHVCPISMTYSAVPVLRRDAELAARMGAAPAFDPLRSVLPARFAKIRRPDRHGDDREAGRLRCARQHDTRRADRQRRISPARPQMVLLRADVRRVSGAGAGAGRPFLLFSAALDAGRPPQRVSPPEAEIKTGQSLQCFERSGVPRRLGAAVRRRGPGRRDHHRDGAPHPPRLRDRRRLG